MQGNMVLYAIWRKVLSCIEIVGEPCFEVDNVFFADTFVSDYGLKLNAIYSNLTQKDVTSYGKISSSIKNSPGNVTIIYTEGKITKMTEIKGSYYVAAKESLTQKAKVSGSVEININDEMKNFDLIKFGDFPQTIAGKDITYSPLVVYNNWYLGSDGYFYEKLKAINENSSVSIPRFSDGTWFKTGTEYYFKVEPIEWRVLDQEFDHDSDKTTGVQKLLLAEKMLAANINFYDDYNSRFLESKTIFTNNYKYSNIRAYLNGIKNQFVTEGGSPDDYSVDWSNNGFLQKAFTKSAQALISTTLVRNSSITTNPDGNSSLWNEGKNEYACDDTNDKIFLLSVQEATETDYGFPKYDIYNEQSTRTRVPTDYAKASRAFHYNLAGGNWFLRSPFYGNNKEIFTVEYTSSITAYIYGYGCGICPAMSIPSY